MRKIRISVTFLGYGHGYINVIPTNYDQWEPVQTDHQDYDLEPGDYTFTYSTVTGNGGSIDITDANTGASLASNPLAAGMDQGNFQLTI